MDITFLAFILFFFFALGEQFLIGIRTTQFDFLVNVMNWMADFLNQMITSKVFLPFIPVIVAFDVLRILATVS